jgi:hypothetical protein
LYITMINLIILRMIDIGLDKYDAFVKKAVKKSNIE